MEFKKNWLSLSASAVICGTLLVGCGGGSSSSSSGGSGGDSGGETTNPYIGTKALSGTFETFGSTTDTSARMISLAAGDTNEIVKLYVMGEDGNLKDTNITCDITGSGAYTCENIAANKEYIVRYMKEVSDGKVLEMKSNVAIADEDVSGVAVDRVSTLIVESITKAVEEAIVGIDLDESKVNEIIASVKDAIKTSIATLVQQGLVEIPSQDDMVVELGENETFESLKGEVKENDNLSDSSSVILTDDSVTNRLNAQKGEAKLSNYSDMTNKELVKEIFAQTGEGDIEDWVVDFLGDKYDQMPDTYTVGGFFAKLDFEHNDDYEAQRVFEKLGMSAQDVVNSINATTENAVAVTRLKDTITEHYARKAKAEKTDEDYEKLSGFPPVLEYLFPESFVSSMTATTKLQNMGQGIALVMFAEEVLVPTIIANLRAQANVPEHELSDSMVKNMHLVEFNPSFIFEDLGFEVGGTYDKIGIEHFEARTDRHWNHETQEDIEFLSVYTGISKPSWWMSDSHSADPDKVTSATLTYPKADGSTATINLEVETDENHGGDDWIGLKHSPWSPCHGGDCQPDTTKMNVLDNVSGDYTVSVTYDGQTISKTFKDQFVLKGASKLYAEFVSPESFPQWPQELNNLDHNEIQNDPELKALQDAFNEKQRNYQISTFALNYDENNDSTDDSVKDVVFKWDDRELNKKLEALNLPEYIVPAYQIGVNLYHPTDLNNDGRVDWEDCNGDNWQKCNTEIFNTWWDNRPIKGNSFTLKTPLRETNTENNERYNIGLNVVFLNKETGREVGFGGHSHAEFEVGAGSSLTGNENINFSGTITAEEGSTVPAKIKVGVTSEKCEFNPTTLLQTCTSSMLAVGTPAQDGTYELAVTVDQFKTAMDNNAWFNLIAFEDADDNNEWTSWNESQTNAENAWWPYEKHFWIDNWGEFVVNTQEHHVNGGETFEHDRQKVTQGEDVNVTDMNFKVFSWN